MNLKERIYDTLKELVISPGISGTESENITSQKIYDILSDMPYFKENREQFGIEEIEGDPYGRKFVWGVVSGDENEKDTLILTGHFDVVGVEEFGHLKSIAFNMEECTKRINELKLDEETLKDLKSGEWIFGRGTADMKFGIALDIELLREFSENRDFNGNLMFLAVPGEESNSEGMIAAVPFLLKLQEQREYNYCGVIVSECSIPTKSNEDFKKIYMGSVGKIMPSFFCVGKETHVVEPLRGLNPNALVSEINRLLESNPNFSDQYMGNTTPPPMCLKQMDLKELYSVQSPLYAAAYYNLLTLNMSENELMLNLKNLALKAFTNVLDDLKLKREAFIKKSKLEAQFLEVEPLVMTYNELLIEVKKNYTDFEKHIKEKTELWKKDKMDNQTIAINIVRETYEKYQNKSPMIVISFIPPYYPHKHLHGINEEHNKFINVIEQTIQYAQENFGEKIIKDDFFMGISDLSYTGIGDSENLDSLASNIVGYGINYSLPLEALSKLNIPGVVFGGEGKDFHKYSERLNVPYSFNVVPELYKRIINSILKK